MSKAERVVGEKDVIDISWQNQKLKRMRDGTSVSLMPNVLRDLAPEARFNPGAVWEAEKKRMADAEEEAAAKEAESREESKGKKGGKKSGSKKKGVNNRAEQIIESREAEKLASAIDRDLEKIANAERRALLDVDVETPLGRFRQLLEILKDAVDIGEYMDPTATQKALAFDCFWALEADPVYQQAVAEEEARAAADDGPAEAKDRKKKKKKEEKSASGKAKKPSRSRPCQILYDFRRHVRAAKKWRKEEGAGLAAFQLNQMADRLPPISPFSRGWRLDGWQTRVLALIDAHQSAVICAPTSSGKTVVSTYAATAQGRVLFCVPSEPLVWQVASMFNKLCGGKTALATNQIQYRPQGQIAKVVVGTPTALENRLTKARGKAGYELEINSKATFFGQHDPGFDFEWAIFDEVHSLDGEEGAALQRLIRIVSGPQRPQEPYVDRSYPKCAILALSATIGNGEELRDWWRQIHGVSLNSVVEDASEARRLELEQHHGRFINLQRYIFANDGLRTLHPCAAVSLTQLQAPTGLRNVSLAFTPRDSFALFSELRSRFEGTDIDVTDLAPEAFFQTFETPRISLEQARLYEEALKEKLAMLANSHPDEVQAVLDAFSVEEMPSDSDVWTIAKALRTKKLLPALVFNLDTFKCVEAFNELLELVEAAEVREKPDWRAELERKATEAAEAMKKAQKDTAARKSGGANQKEALLDAQATGETQGITMVDVDEPHPDYVLFLKSSTRVSALEIDDATKECWEDKLVPGHPWLRGLRRGIGLYIDDACFPAYRRVVQRFAQKGKLGVVFSDHSLAYGVNMPFRSCVFYGSMGTLLTPLMAQQMSGRAGRRGLDREGNLVYANMPWDKIRSLMLGRVPAIRGEDPLYPLLALQKLLCDTNAVEFEDPRFHMLTDATMRELGQQTFEQFCAGEGANQSYHDTSLQILEKLGYATEVVTERAGVTQRSYELLVRRRVDSATNLVLEAKTKSLYACLWELKHRAPESLVLEAASPFLLNSYTLAHMTNVSKNMMEASADSTSLQSELLFILLQIFDRQPIDPELYDYPGASAPLQENKFIDNIEGRRVRYDAFVEILRRSQARLVEDELPDLPRLQLKVGVDTPLDPSVFIVFLNSSFKALPELSTLAKHNLKERLYEMGTILQIMHNQLARERPYIFFSSILRKCFNRIRWILRDLVMEDANAGFAGMDSLDDFFAANEEKSGSANTAGAGGPAENGHGPNAGVLEEKMADMSVSAPAAPAAAASPAAAPTEVKDEAGEATPSAESLGLMPGLKKKKKKKLPAGGLKG